MQHELPDELTPHGSFAIGQAIKTFLSGRKNHGVAMLAQLRKAIAEDGLGNELSRITPARQANAFLPLAVKAAFRIWAPSNGGVATPLNFTRGSTRR